MSKVYFGVRFDGSESEFKRIANQAVDAGGKLNISIDDQWDNMQFLSSMFGHEWKYVGVNHITNGVAAITRLDPEDIEYTTEAEFINAVEAHYKEIV